MDPAHRLTATDEGQEVVEFLRRMPPPPALWTPALGPETLDYIERLRRQDLGAEDLAAVRNYAVGILSRCVPPSGTVAMNTGLVVGYVQSGKTTSFTALTAMARDNGFRLVILLAGISLTLLDQSRNRFIAGLRLLERSTVEPGWLVLSNPTRESDLERIRNALSDWDDPTVPDRERRTVLVTVLKHHGHIRNLAELLGGLDLQDCPALVIDDEADQAGLNNLVRQGDESATYARIAELRRRLPWHGYVQYTATPQAPLLISIADILSPDFVVTLPPGAEYTGGQAFFRTGGPHLIRVVPEDQIPSEENELEGPPESLLDAMRLFFIGVAAGYEARRRGIGPKNRSMMIHPSRHIQDHARFIRWVTARKQMWEDVLADALDPDRPDVVQEFHGAWHDLARTVQDLPPFELLEPILHRRIRETDVVEVNAASGSTPRIEWHRAYGHILVGGQTLDRGFTVEGLTVTYMPRNIGVGNADTVQQRARFFGYKRSYLGYCRAFLSAQAEQAFSAYVEHEREMHRQLTEIMENGTPLRQWRRAFLLDGRLRPTRQSVLDRNLLRFSVSEWWNSAAPQGSAHAAANNGGACREFVSQTQWAPDPGHASRTEAQIHARSVGLRLQDVMDRLLVRLEFPQSRDAVGLAFLLLQLRNRLDENPDLLCDVYNMSRGRVRERELDEQDQIVNLFQGKNPKTGPVIYPGDRKIRAEDRTTIQLHWLRLTRGDQTIADDVPALALFVPPALRGSWITLSDDSA